MPSPHAPAAAPGLPDATPVRAVEAMRAGLEEHFAALASALSLSAVMDAEAGRIAEMRSALRGTALALAPEAGR